MKQRGIKLKKGQVWNCDLSEFIKDHSARPVIITDIFENTIEVAVVYSSEKVVNGKLIKRKTGPYDLEIKKWKEFGFENKSNVECDMKVEIYKDKLLKYLFDVDKNLLNAINIYSASAETEAFNNPWNFLNWCKRKNVKDTIRDGVHEKEKIRGLETVVETKKMNYLDAALIIHLIDRKSKLIWFLINNEFNYLLSMFKNNKNKYFYFFWFLNLNDAYVSKGFKNEEDLINDMCNKISSDNIEYVIFNKDCINYIDNELVFDKTTNKEFFDKIDSLINKKIKESYSFFSNIKFK